MFVGHYGISFAAKRLDKTIPLWVLFLAVQLLDLGWGVLVPLGVEKVRIVPGITASNPLDLYYMPYTHSLVAALLWSLAGYVEYRSARAFPPSASCPQGRPGWIAAWRNGAPPSLKEAHAYRQRQRPRRHRRRGRDVHPGRRVVFPRAVREAMGPGARLHPGAARGDEEARRGPRVRGVGTLLPGHGVRARAARLLHPGDELRAGRVARIPAVARLRGDDRPHRPHVLRQPARGVGDRRRVPARLPAADGRDRHGVALNAP